MAKLWADGLWATNLWAPGLWEGSLGLGNGNPDHLIIEVQPAGTLSGVPLAVQPRLTVRDVDGLQVAGYGGLCIAQVVMGNAQITAGGVVAAVDGDIQFTELTLVGSGDITLAFSVPTIQGIIATNEINLPPGSDHASRAHRRSR